MLEWAQVHGNYYGTSRAFVEEQLARGKSILLDIDVQGAEKIMASGLALTSIFILPPSLDVLEQRLRGRKTDTEAVIRTRLENARKEMEKQSLYTHVVINDDLDTAVSDLAQIFAKEMDIG